ncbi:hypothetical protein Taro_017425 [Colocasia esculenta]|uniref:CCHC-type domain-containing protein n=1 Tax=Colocasia esculenta TaxID=4460 RepID=A0A843URC4_COLES|nr:hypothetical protein [Colocasia esculenta]
MAHEINIERLGESSSRTKHNSALKAPEESDGDKSIGSSEDGEAFLSRRLQCILAKKKYQSGRRYFKKGKEFKKPEAKDVKRSKPTCYECKKPRHIKEECPKLEKVEFKKKDNTKKFKKFKKKAMAAAWDNDTDSDSELSSSEEEENANLTFMANIEDKWLKFIAAMASRGRRCGAPAREGEQRREEQVPAPQGPVLPPPLPVDYGVFMQGLVQAMQTQAHTQAALQAQLEAQERADVWWPSLLCTRFEDGAIDVAWDEFGSMTVLEYEARFAELSKYAPHIVTDECRKEKKFVMGLKPSLRTRLVAFNHRTLDEALSTASRQEGEMEQYLEEKKASRKRPAATFQRQDKKKAVYQAPQRPVTTSSV